MHDSSPFRSWPRKVERKGHMIVNHTICPQFHWGTHEHLTTCIHVGCSVQRSPKNVSDRSGWAPTKLENARDGQIWAINGLDRRFNLQDFGVWVEWEMSIWPTTKRVKWRIVWLIYVFVMGNAICEIKRLPQFHWGQRSLDGFTKMMLYHSFKMAKKTNDISNSAPTGTTGRVPLWFVGVIGGTAVLSIVSLFFYGSYTGLGSSL